MIDINLKRLKQQNISFIIPCDVNGKIVKDGTKFSKIKNVWNDSLQKDEVLYTDEAYTFTLYRKDTGYQPLTCKQARAIIKEKYGFDDFMIVPRGKYLFMPDDLMFDTTSVYDCKGKYSYQVYVNLRKLSKCLNLLSEEDREYYNKVCMIPNKITLYKTFVQPSIEQAIKEILPDCKIDSYENQDTGKILLTIKLGEDLNKRLGAALTKYTKDIDIDWSSYTTRACTFDIDLMKSFNNVRN